MLGPEADLRQLFSGLALVAVACVHRQFQPDRHQHNALFLPVHVKIVVASFMPLDVFFA